MITENSQWSDNQQERLELVAMVNSSFYSDMVDS